MEREDEFAPPALPDDTVRSRLRELSTWRRALLAACVVLVTGLGTLQFLPRADLEAVSPVRLVAGVVTFGLLALALGLIVLRPLHRRPVSAPLAFAFVGAALVAPTLFAFLPEAHHERLLHPESFADEGAGFWGRAAACLFLGSLLALPFIAIVALMDRHDRIGRSRALMAAIAGGLIGNLALLLHCPIVSHEHLLAGHATVPVLLALLIGAFAWRRYRHVS